MTNRIRTDLALITSFCALAACEPSNRNSQPSTGSAPRTPSAQAPPEPSATPPSLKASAAPPTPTDECKGLRKQFADRFAAASNACISAKDCTCSPGGIDPAGCGRVVDMKTATDLFDLYSQIRKRCGLDRHCAARRCLVKCEGGRCQEDTKRFDGPPSAKDRW